MQSNNKIQIDCKDILESINTLYALVEGFELDYGGNFLNQLQFNLEPLKKKMLKISKNGIVKPDKRQSNNETVDIFIADRIVKSENGRLSIAEMYSFYCDRCKIKGIAPATKGVLLKTLKRRYTSIHGSKLFKIKGKVVRCYEGFDLKK